MTPQEFKRLSGYSAARAFAPRTPRPIVSRRMAKSAGRKPQGRPLVGLERVFNHPSFSR